MNDKLEIYKEKIFDEIKHVDENGRDFWYARELAKILEYTDWRNFIKVINKAKNACENSNNNMNEHLVELNRVLVVGNNAKMNVTDFKLSRYMCYLIVQNADSGKQVVALGQTYFALQTRRQELLNEGYKGLYGGENVKMIKKRKKLEDKDDVLDYMGSTELAANWFRITQTDEAIKQNNVDNLDEANKTHNKVGKEVRKTMKKLSGIYPEELPTPEKSIKQIEKEELKQIEKQQKNIIK